MNCRTFQFVESCAHWLCHGVSISVWTLEFEVMADFLSVLVLEVDRTNLVSHRANLVRVL